MQSSSRILNIAHKYKLSESFIDCLSKADIILQIKIGIFLKFFHSLV